MLKIEDTVTYIHLYEGDKTIKKRTDKYYYWYKSRTIQKTHGDYDGKLLDGEFKSFYANKNLKEKGAFSKGLKTGKWISWNTNGEYVAVYQWKRGYKNGQFREYDEKGQIIKCGSYKDDLLNGSVVEYTPDGKNRSVKYDKGEIVIPVENKKQQSKKEDPKNEKETAPTQ